MGVVESATPTRKAVRRDPERRLIGGVCAGIARYFGVDPLPIRIAFVVATAAGGFGAVVYVLCLVLIPAEAGAAQARPRRAGRAAIEVGAGAGLLLLSLLLALRGLGIWFSDAVVWPVVLVAAGAALLWRQSELTMALNRTAARGIVTTGKIDGVTYSDIAMNAAAEAFSAIRVRETFHRAPRRRSVYLFRPCRRRGNPLAWKVVSGSAGKSTILREIRGFFFKQSTQFSARCMLT